MIKLPSTNVQGIVLVILGVFALSVMDACMKLLLDDGYSVEQLLAVRSWMIVPGMLIWAWRRLPAGALTTKRPKVHFVRVVLGFFAPFCFFNALSVLPLADATVIFFGTTFIMTALSVPILKEQVGPHRWAAVVCGFLGVVIAAQPGGAFLGGDGSPEWAYGVVMAVLSSFAYASFMLTTRWMGPGEGTFKQVLYFHVWLGLVTSVLAAPAFRAMPGADFALLVLAALIVVAGHLCLTHGFAIAPVGLVAPFEYTALVWAMGIGYVLWGHIPEPPVMVGAGIIVASGLYLLHRETRKAVAQRPAKAGETVIDGASPPAGAPVPPSLIGDGGKPDSSRN